MVVRKRRLGEILIDSEQSTKSSLNMHLMSRSQAASVWARHW